MPSTISKKIIAILCSDLHLSQNAPIWRSNEPDWFEAMKRPLLELRRLETEYDCPVFCAGDIFDRWNSSAELINFALTYLPRHMLAIPGQHDLPLHNIKEIDKSAFWTLVASGRITMVEGHILIEGKNMVLTGTPFGDTDIDDYTQDDGLLRVHLMHHYIWKGKHSYPGAPEANQITRLRKTLEEKCVDIYVFGDNHKGFIDRDDVTIFNCGGFMRRKSDEVDYKPRVGLLTDTGDIIIHKLDISKDKHLDVSEAKKQEEKFDMGALAEELKKLNAEDLDFESAIKEYLEKNKISKETKNIILKAIENGKC